MRWVPAPPRPDLRELPIEGQLVIYDPVARVTHLLNESAAAIWTAWRDAPSDADALTARLASSHGVPEERVRLDVRRAMSRFEELGLLGEPPSTRFRPPQWGDAVDVEPRLLATELTSTIPAGRYRALDYPFEVRATEPSLAEAVRELLGGLAEPPQAGGNDEGAHARPRRYDLVGDGEQILVLVDGTVVRTATTPAMALTFLSWHIHRQALRHSDRLVRLHASAIRVGDLVVALPAPPESGKSTLVAGLVRSGYRYVTDEAVAFDPVTREVLPLPLPITLDEGSWELFPELDDNPPADTSSMVVAPQLLRAEAVGRSTPAQLGACVFHRFRPGATTTLRRAAAPEALVLLLENAFGLDDAGDVAFEAMTDVAREVPCWTLEHGGLDAAIDAIAEVVAGVTREQG
jgi:hypothetical protein